MLTGRLRRAVRVEFALRARQGAVPPWRFAVTARGAFGGVLVGCLVQFRWRGLVQIHPPSCGANNLASCRLTTRPKRILSTVERPCLLRLATAGCVQSRWYGLARSSKGYMHYQRHGRLISSPGAQQTGFPSSPPSSLFPQVPHRESSLKLRSQPSRHHATSFSGWHGETARRETE